MLKPRAGTETALSTTWAPLLSQKTQLCGQRSQPASPGAQPRSPPPFPLPRWARLRSRGHSPGLISSSRSFGSSGGCNRLFLRQQRAGYVYSWPGARPVDGDEGKINSFRLSGALEITLTHPVIHSERKFKPREVK